MSLSFYVADKLGSKNTKSAAIVVFCDDTATLLGNIDSPELQKRAQALIDASKFSGELGLCVKDFSPQDSTQPVLCIMGAGKLQKLSSQIQKLAQSTYKNLSTYKNATIVWGDVICQKHFSQFVIAFAGAHYRFDHHKKDKKPATLSSTHWVNTKDPLDDYKAALEFSTAIISGQNTTKDLANEAPNIANPSYIAKQAKQLGKDFEELVTVRILDEKDLKKLGMGCFLAVAQGSENAGQLAVIEYFGKTKKTAKAKLKNPIALVGKGITFDTGGISLKPAANMEEMKFDMGGAAAMFGVARGLCQAKLPLDVVIVLALAENMPSGKATRPGDVVHAMDGTTVEIINTDAEGRLVLCDALCYAQKQYAPDTIIDAATLTGACVVALGEDHSGLYSNDEDLLFALEEASEQAGDRVWHMPLDEEFSKQLKSPIADLQNIGGRYGGANIAACFLQHFIQEGVAWAHLDIAGTAWIGGKDRHATGRPVSLLMHYLQAKAQ